ncbi:hypothetical protein ACFQ1I_23265 [Kitasatospora arboriphila]
MRGRWRSPRPWTSSTVPSRTPGRRPSPALVGEDDPAVRAAVLRTRLIGMDDTAADRLAEVPTPWRAEWAMWPGSSKGWPGPVAGLAVGTGGYAGQLLLADPGGVVRTVDTSSGRPLARVALPDARPLRGLAAAPDGTVLLLDAEGTAAVLPERPGSRQGGAAAEQALHALQAAVRGELSALATTGPQGLPAVADDTGSVHRCRPNGGTDAEKLHEGPVTALAGTAGLLLSGGFDGAVRRWDAAADGPEAEPVDRRGSQVTAVAAVDTPAGRRRPRRGRTVSYGSAAGRGRPGRPAAGLAGLGAGAHRRAAGGRHRGGRRGDPLLTARHCRYGVRGTGPGAPAGQYRAAGSTERPGGAGRRVLRNG